MFVYAIETNGRTVAFTKEVDGTMLAGILNGERDEGLHLRETLANMQDADGALWDCVSPLSARLATDAESHAYNEMTAEYREKEDVSDESLLVYRLKNRTGETVLTIPPALR